MQRSVHFSTIVYNMSLAFEMKFFASENEIILKRHDLQVVPKCKFLKWGYHFSNGHPACTVEHFANIFTV